MLKIVENSLLIKREQILFPRSKKKRIRKKWYKNEKYWITYPDPAIYQSKDTLFCHPITAIKIRSMMKEDESTFDNSYRNVYHAPYEYIR